MRFRSLVCLLGTAILVVAIAGFVVPAGAASLSVADLKEYQIAFKAIDAGRWKVALKHAARPQNQLPAKAVHWLYIQTAGSGANFDEIAVFIAANPDWPRRDALALRAEQAMNDAVPDKEILSWFRDNPPKTGSGFLLYGAALKRAGLSEMLEAQAIRAWREINMTHREERDFRRLYRKLFSEEDELYRLERLLWSGKTTAAMRQARRVPEAYRRLAEARILLRRRAGGVDGAIARVPPNLIDHPGLVYERLRWRRRKGRNDDAIELLAWPDMQTTRPDLWWKERAILARKALEDGDAQLAYDIASNHRVESGGGLVEAEWFSGWVALRYLNDPEQAFPHFRDMYANVGFPVSRSRAAYWVGRAAEATGESQIAMEWYAVAAQFTTSFYGQMAAMKLPASALPAVPDDPPISPELRQAFANSELTILVELLAQIAAHDTVKALVRYLAVQYNDAAYLALTAELAMHIARPDLAVYTSRQAIKSNIVLYDGFPELSVTSSRIADLAVVFGLIRQESGFEIDAVSHAGARGLMQLMPATAKTVSRWERIPYQRSALTTDVSYNVRLGSTYLLDLLEKFDGVLPMALAGYNAGPHRVQNWIKRFGDPRSMSLEETIDWMESIPFTETRNYVQRVLENITVYRQRDAGGPVMLTMTFETG